MLTLVTLAPADLPSQVGAVILAAGASSRMGRPKLLLPWNGGTVLSHLVTVWQELGVKQVAVVYAAANKKLLIELNRLGFPTTHRIINPVPQEGMFSSIRCAAQWPGWLPEITELAIVLGDQPQLKLSTLRALLRFSAAHSGQVCQPSYGGKRGHPVVIPRRLFNQLSTSEAPTLKDFLARSAETVRLCRVSDPGLHLDIDRPEDYERVRQLLQAGSPTRPNGRTRAKPGIGTRNRP